MSLDKEEAPVEMEVDGENEASNNEAKGGDAKSEGDDKKDSDAEASAAGKKRPRSPADDGEGSKKRDAILTMLEVKKPECKETRESDKISVASIAAASQLSSAMGWNGLGSLLSLSLLTNNGNSSSSSSSSRNSKTSSSAASSSEASSGSTKNGSLPSTDQVMQAAIKAVNDAPPFVHLSKTDSAPQLKITDSVCAVSTDSSANAASRDASASNNEAAAAETTSTPNASILINDRLAVKQGEGEMRGYRMTRSSHGVTPGSGNFYYEVVILQPPKASELVKALPPNVRLGKKLQREMEKALREEVEAENEAKLANETDAEAKNNKPTTTSSFGAHVRLGWSMRTGDLQAPVGYDKWSYGIRDIQGSKIHCSKREDNWGGEDFGPGDVIGCAISMVSDGEAESSTETSNAGADQDQQPKANHIRFFKNGLPMGEFVITKGKRSGGEAFIIPDGVYYPAISLYMGATVKVNFGPHFIHPPRKLPTGMTKRKGGGVFQPVSDLCKAPLSVEEASAKVVKEQKTLFFRKADNTAQQKRFLELVETEVKIQRDAYQSHRRKHVQDVMEERKKRKLKSDDLEQDEYFVANAATIGAEEGSGD